ncbi:hypothetical protein Sango_2935300 [Sesamum angolense]|uniref:Transposase-associated domain-containing protein n=1 Tax=Sesamum angolense TaxID=2727404 RepID=A0AAE1T5C0_9LAMI|nr:hypothetical protein Sango_2935300 [Sesamum angolense]
MYNKNLSRRVGLTPEFEDGVKIFIEWAKGQHRHMDGDKIKCPFRKCKNTQFGTPNEVSYHLGIRGFMLEYYNWTSHGEDIVQDYFEALGVPQVSRSQPQLAMLRARRVVDDSKCTETVAYQSEEVVAVPIVAIDNQTYDLRDPPSQWFTRCAGSCRYFTETIA